MFNTNSGCVKCSPGCDGGRVKVQDCTKDNDIICRCPEGKFWETALVYCKLCTKCKPGEILIKNCTHSHNSECKLCEKGSYAETAYSCKICSQCKVGEYTKKKCSWSDDTICESMVHHIPPTIPQVIQTQKNTSNEGPSSDSSKDSVYNLSVALGVFGFLVILSIVVHVLHVKRIKRRSSTTKKTESLTSVGSSEHETFFNKKTSAPVVDHDPGYLVRNLNPEVIIKLSRLLNPPGLRNWMSVASLLGFSQIDISNFNIEKELSFQKMIEAWSTQREATVYKLYLVFLNLERDDCATILEGILSGV
ncbi:tumor necrosis factor receptor superfamily member 16 isoform X2 [Exaiptasia diaphana]|nr:tumor necrosis factor receptor superfamily member 16 isoform X2 [Exaiptasia diaphana]